VERPGISAIGREVKTLIEMARALAFGGEFSGLFGSAGPDREPAVD
jgi:hypothetical protein